MWAEIIACTSTIHVEDLLGLYLVLQLDSLRALILDDLLCFHPCAQGLVALLRHCGLGNSHCLRLIRAAYNDQDAQHMVNRSQHALVRAFLALV